MLKAIILDMDGTIVDSMPFMEKIVHKELIRAGIKEDKVNIDDMVDELAERVASRPLPPGIRMVIQLFYHIGRSAGLGRYKSIIFMIKSVKQIRIATEQATLIPETVEFLDYWSERVPLALFTMSNTKTTRLKLKEFDLLTKFRFIVTRDDVKPKPHPDGVIKILRKFNCKPDEVVYIGDLPFDVAAGNNASVSTIGVTTGAATEKILRRFTNPVTVVHNLNQATEYIISTFQIPEKL